MVVTMAFYTHIFCKETLIRIFELFKELQIRRDMNFSCAQLEFLSQIKDYIIANAYLANDDFQGFNDACGDTNGIFVAKALFKQNFAPLLDELNLALLSGLKAG